MSIQELYIESAKDCPRNDINNNSEDICINASKQYVSSISPILSAIALTSLCRKRSFRSAENQEQIKKARINREQGYTSSTTSLKSPFHSVDFSFDMESICTFYAVAAKNGKKNGSGQIWFGAPLDCYVYSTAWVNDYSSGVGYIYNHSTSIVIARVFDNCQIEFFSKCNGNQPVWGILDEDNGSRWEGICLNGQSCGYGEYYDEYNRLVYRGMAIEGRWEGYGTAYYPLTMISEKIYSCGNWCHGEILGDSSTYDLHSELVSSGYRVADNMVEDSLVISLNTDWDLLHCRLRELTIDDNSLNSLKFMNLDLLRYLEILTIGSHSLRSCHSIIISDLSMLRTIHIGNYSFTQHDNSLELLLSETDSIISIKKQCILHHLHSLEEVTIGVGSFSDFSSLSLTELPMVKSISFGTIEQPSCNFFFAEELHLIDMPHLKTVLIGNYTFYYGICVKLHNLPSLHSFHSGQATFFRTLTGKKGECSLDELPRLRRFQCDSESFASINKLKLRREIGGTSKHIAHIVNSFWSLRDIETDRVISSHTRIFLSAFLQSC